MPWVKGQSGNPGGATRQVKAARVQLDVSSPQLMKKAITLALNTGTAKEDENSLAMLKLLVGRIVPQQVEKRVEHDGSVDHNHRMVPDGRAVIAAIRAEWEERRALADAQGVSEDGSLLPAEVHPGEKGRGAPVAVLADKRGGGKS